MRFVLILGNTNWSNRYLADSIEKTGCKCRIVRPELFTVFPDHDDVIYMSQKYDLPYKLKAENISAVVARTNHHVLSHFKKMGVPITDALSERRAASDKIRSTYLFSQAKIPTPKTISNVGLNVNFKWISNRLKLPAIGKLAYGSQGKYIFFIENLESFRLFDDFARKAKKDYIIQSFITTASPKQKPKDIRVIVSNGKAISAMVRFAASGFKTNISLGGIGEKLELTPEVSNIAEKAAAAIGIKYCGIDIAYDIEKEKFLVYEANSNMSLKGIVTVTNQDVGVELAADIKRLALTSHKYVTPPDLSRFKDLPGMYMKTHEHESEFSIDPKQILL